MEMSNLSIIRCLLWLEIRVGFQPGLLLFFYFSTFTGRNSGPDENKNQQQFFRIAMTYAQAHSTTVIPGKLILHLYSLQELPVQCLNDTESLWAKVWLCAAKKKICNLQKYTLEIQLNKDFNPLLKRNGCTTHGVLVWSTWNINLNGNEVQ